MATQKKTPGAEIARKAELAEKAGNRPVIGPMTNATEAETKTAAAIHASKIASTALRDAGIYDLFFLCEHGSHGHLNKLFLGMTDEKDRLALRVFIRNVHEALGAKVVKIVTKATADVPAGIHVADNSKEARALLVSKGYAWLENIPWVTKKDSDKVAPSADTAIENAVKSLTKRLLEAYPANPIVAEFVKSMKSAGDFAETQMKNWKAVQELTKAGYKIEEPKTGTDNA